MNSTRTLILVAHGSRHDSWNRQIRQFTTDMEAAHGARSHFQRFATGYMELSQPSIPDVIRDEAGHGNELVVVPLFLTASKHMKEDVPREIASVAETAGESESGVLYRMGNTRITLLRPPEAEVLLADNVVNRVEARSIPHPGTAGILVYYGTRSHQERWDAMAKCTCGHLEQRMPGMHWSWNYGGESVQFSPEPLQRQIEQLGTEHDRVLVIPALVGYGVVQREVIAKATEPWQGDEQVVVFQDSILPDARLAERFLQYAIQQVDGL